MPKEVDHDERRRELLEAVWRVIVRDGIEGTTIRGIAKETGCRELLEAVWRVIVRDGIEGTTIRGIAKETGWSTGVLSHYFADKDEIISSALGLAYERIATRWDEKLDGLAGSSALYELVLDNLPLDEERQLETQLLMNYWSMMIRGHDLTDRPRRRGPLLIDLLTRYVREGQEAGEIRGDEAPEDVAERLLGLIDGFSLHSLLSPQRLSDERQVALIDEEFKRLREATAVTNTRKTTSHANRRRRTYA